MFKYYLHSMHYRVCFIPDIHETEELHWYIVQRKFSQSLMIEKNNLQKKKKNHKIKPLLPSWSYAYFWKLICNSKLIYPLLLNMFIIHKAYLTQNESQKTQLTMLLETQIYHLSLLSYSLVTPYI